MRIYTAHLHPVRLPVLVREGIAWGALFFGPLWLIRHGASIAAAFATTALIFACTAAPPSLRPALAFGIFLLLGVIGHDLRRWSLALGRYHLAHVVAARSRDEAFVRLLSSRADLRQRLT